jgi:hypothetical protein
LHISILLNQGTDGDIGWRYWMEIVAWRRRFEEASSLDPLQGIINHCTNTTIVPSTVKLQESCKRGPCTCHKLWLHLHLNKVDYSIPTVDPTPTDEFDPDLTLVEHPATEATLDPGLFWIPIRNFNGGKTRAPITIQQNVVAIAGKYMAWEVWHG